MMMQLYSGLKSAQTLVVSLRYLALASIFVLPMSVLAGGIQTLSEVAVNANEDELIGVANSASEGTITREQLATRPLLRPAEVLEAIPGMIVSQHSGSGKANQYYLRGFNLDHGTDFATSLLGMPLNLPSHAHGQGYLDLQFLIPELIERVQYRKGALAADVGDFATAGSAAIDYVRELDAPFIDITVGGNNYRRALLAGSTSVGNGQLLAALEVVGSDGPWVVDENLRKRNAMLRYSQGTRDNGWSMTALAYSSSFTSTDQVPKRAIASGMISRFGSLDPTDGGATDRYSLSWQWAQREANQQRRANAYVIDYSLNLFSNFTYCLNDIALNGNCNHGDQFEQVDRRQVYGGSTSNTWFGTFLSKPSSLSLGIQGRLDDIGNVGLYTTTARARTNTIRSDKVTEGNIGLYAEQQVQWLEKFRTVSGLRVDSYRFDVSSDRTINSGVRNASIASPKLALIFGPWLQTEYYLQVGFGFHSNDARGVTSRINPDFRSPDYLSASKSADPLVRAKNYEFGIRTAIVPNLQTSLAFWQLDLGSELVFTGDAGTTEPSAPSRRRGIELANYWTPIKGLTIDADVAASRARFRGDEAIGARYIPGSVDKVASIGLAWSGQGRWSAGLRMRYFGPRPLIEDNSVHSAGTTIFNLQAGYKLSKHVQVKIDVLNLFNRKVSDIDYYYQSQLASESAPVADVHTHPAEPRTLRASLRLTF